MSIRSHGPGGTNGSSQAELSAVPARRAARPDCLSGPVWTRGLPWCDEVSPDDSWEGEVIPALRKITTTVQAVIVADAAAFRSDSVAGRDERNCQFVVPARLRNLPLVPTECVLASSLCRTTAGYANNGPYLPARQLGLTNDGYRRRMNSLKPKAPVGANLMPSPMWESVNVGAIRKNHRNQETDQFRRFLARMHECPKGDSPASGWYGLARQANEVNRRRNFVLDSQDAAKLSDAF